MASELSRMASGELRPRREQKELAQAAKQIVAEVQLAGLKADGTLALAVHIMEQVRDVVAYRRQLVEGDPEMAMILSQFEAQGYRQVQQIQRDLFNPWGL